MVQHFWCLSSVDGMFQAFKQRDFRAGTAGTHGGRDGDAAYTDTHFFEFIFHCFEGLGIFFSALLEALPWLLTTLN